MRTRAPTAVVALALVRLLAGCGAPSVAEDPQSKATSHEDGDAAQERATGADAAAVDPRSAVMAMFKDKIEFTIPELTGGKTNCDDVLRRKDIAADVVAWPDELKTFLTDEVVAFPAVDKIVKSVAQIYLVKDEVLQDPATHASSAGLACDRGTDYKGVLFLSLDSFVTDRGKGSVGMWQDLKAVSAKYVLLEAGDNAAVTLIHEMLHAVDNKLYANTSDSAAKAKRQAIFDLSWQAYTKPRYDRIGLYSLTGDDPGGKKPGGGCRTHLKGEPESLALAGQSPEDLEKDLRYLADETNFIVPYTMASAAEDWAESLTVYYFGVYKQSWQVRTVYPKDVHGGVSGQTALYRHDTQAILQTSARQKEKLCKMAELMFGLCKL